MQIQDEWRIEEALKKFAQGPDKLEATLADLSEADLDRQGAQEGWTIREIVHHLADEDTMQATFILKMALLNSGTTFDISWHPGNRAMSETLNYTGRPIGLSFALFQANREHIVQMLSNLPPVWDRYVVFRLSPEEEVKITIGEWIQRMAEHLQEHVSEIDKIRQQLETEVISNGADNS